MTCLHLDFSRPMHFTCEASSPERTPGRSPEGHVASLVQEAKWRDWLGNGEVNLYNYLHSLGSAESYSCRMLVSFVGIHTDSYEDGKKDALR